MKHPFTSIRRPISDMLSKRYFQVSGLLSIGLLLLGLGLIWWQLFPDVQYQLTVPLHYNIHFGVDLIGPWWRIFSISIAGGVVLLVNALGALLLWKKEPVLSYFFVGTMVMAEVLLLVALVFVVILNLSYYG